MIKPGDIISHTDMCKAEAGMLQKGMNFRFKGGNSVILMSTRTGAPYSDKVIDNGKVIIYEGHDISKTKDVSNPKDVDQPMYTDKRRLTQNGLFFQAAKNFSVGKSGSELVKVYEKIKNGIWAFNGVFELIDADIIAEEKRKVFKFTLKLTDKLVDDSIVTDLVHDRVIPSNIKLEVWKRDKGCCKICKSKDNLHFDHIIPFSKGGSSLVAENIQLLCARHNIIKKDKIE